MNLQDAIQLVGQKFNEEQQDVINGELAEKYADSFEKYPVVMEVATQFVGDQIIQQHYEARKAAAAQGQVPGGGTPPIQA